MMPESSGDEPLDFSAPVSSAPTAPTCAACKKPVADQYWSAGSVVVCGSCKAAVEQGQQPAPDAMSRVGRYGRAAMFGFGAMLVGSLIWYAVAKLLNLEIGLIAILLGFMVGRAVFVGSGKRGGRRYQVLAVFLTYLGIGVAYAPFAYEAMRESAHAKATAPQPGAAAANSAEAPTPDRPAAEAEGLDSLLGTGEATPTAPEQPRATQVILGVGVLLVGILTLPVIITIGGLPGSLIGLLIYGFALVQAWRLTRSATVEFTGPYRIGGATPA
jgi:hypothetical protein